MARIRGRKGRPDGGYTRLMGDEDLGALLSKVHGAVIAAGSELERMVLARANMIDDLDEFLKLDLFPEGVHVASKQQIKKSSTLNYAGSEPDLMVVRRSKTQIDCFVVELKDGDAFDTKKAAAEQRSLHSFIARNTPVLPGYYYVHARVCSFNQDDRDVIYAGFKGKVPPDEIMTGREFCALLGLDYDDIRETREADQEDNLAFFIEELLEIAAVKSLIDGQR